jgi:hypothetical protein
MYQYHHLLERKYFVQILQEAKPLPNKVVIANR